MLDADAGVLTFNGVPCVDPVCAIDDVVVLRIPNWADPERRRPQQMTTNDGGRGLYWLDPNGHILEILTVPFGGWSKQASPQLRGTTSCQ